MGSTHKDNKTGDIPASFITDSAERTKFLTDDEFAVQRTIEQGAAELPAEKQTTNNINYLGSSYSGADIKVLVNLYNYQGSLDTIINKLQKDQKIASRVAESATNLISGGLTAVASEATGDTTFAERKKNILLAAGLSGGVVSFEGDEITQEAANTILSIFSGVDLTSFIEIARTHRTLQSLANTETGRAEELSNKIQDLEQNQKNHKGAFVELGTLQTISTQSHREKFAIRALGHSYAKAFTKGPRTIAGSMIFTVFNEHAFAGLMRMMAGKVEESAVEPEISSLIPDQLPPLDFTILFANEYGQTSEFRMYGVEFMTDGVTYSIEDLLSENVIQFVARDIDPLVNKGRIPLDRKQRNITDGYKRGDRNLTGSKLLNMENDYLEYLNRLKVRRRLINR